jgi:hypothetical protein
MSYMLSSLCNTREGHVDLVQYLLDCEGSDKWVFMQSRNGRTALHTAGTQVIACFYLNVWSEYEDDFCGSSQHSPGIAAS